MIEHMVLFKFMESVDAEHPQKAVQAILDLKSSVPGIIDLSAGLNFADRSQGFHVGLVVRLKDREALATYLAHPNHIAVVGAYFKPYLADLIAVDYEI